MAWIVTTSGQRNRLARWSPAFATSQSCPCTTSKQWRSPDLVEGAWFRDDVTRMDDQQHALSALLAAAGALGPVGP